MKYIFVFAVIAMFAFASCAKEEMELKNTVNAYTRLLAEALANNEPGGLVLFTSNAQMKTISAYITFNLKDHRVIVNDLESLEFLDVEVAKDGQSATVLTREGWVFHYIDDKTRKRVTDDEHIGYENTYHLVRVEERWVVDRIDVKEIKPKKDVDK